MSPPPISKLAYSPHVLPFHEKRRCAGHKEQGHVDIISRRCDHPGCSTIPSFFFIGQSTGPKFCARHKQPGMEDYHKRKRVCMMVARGKNDWRGCSRSPSFGFFGCKRVSCAEHKVGGMINLNVVTCRHLGCRLIPNFARRGETPKFCGKHKEASCSMNEEGLSSAWERVADMFSASAGRGFINVTQLPQVVNPTNLNFVNVATCRMEGRQQCIFSMSEEFDEPICV